MKKGISLIILVITIIVILILAGAIILSIAQNNPIVSAQEASFKATLQEYNSELSIVLAQQYSLSQTFDPGNFSASAWDGNLLNINGTVKQYITSLTVADAPNYIIFGGNLVYIGTSQTLKDLAKSLNTLIPKTEFSYTGSPEIFYANQAGRYKVELWGSQGGGTSGGMGGYTSGEITLIAGSVFSIQVGSTTTTGKGGYNGGGTAGGSPSYGGGGATDIRTTYSKWDNVTGLRSRIMVAAAGGGLGGYNVTQAGYAGGLVGSNGFGNDYGICGTQTTSGGSRYNIGLISPGSFGKGGSATWSSESIGSGGSGYYGGGSGGGQGDNGSGAGGSSFISGYTGCNAINSSGVHTGQPNHFSGYVFTNYQMIDGNSSMTSPTGLSETGHTGNGYARITYLGT